jgi:hypothetical protein
MGDIWKKWRREQQTEVSKSVWIMRKNKEESM